MGLIVKSNTFSAGQTIIASQHNTNFDTLYTEINGELDNDNINASAAIAGTKISPAFGVQNVSATGKLAMTGTGNNNVIVVANAGTSSAITINQSGLLVTGQNALYVSSSTIQTAGVLLEVATSNTASTHTVMQIVNAGTGVGLSIDQNGDGDALSIDQALNDDVIICDNNGTYNAITFRQTGNLASGRYLLYLDNNGTPADGAGKAIRFDGCSVNTGSTTVAFTANVAPAGASSATQGWIPINIDGTIRYVPYW
jgi:hypothetical protein